MEPGHMNTAVQAALHDFSASSELNRLPAECGGGRIFSDPLIGVARGDDHIFEKLKTVVAEEHLTPVEMWLKSGLPDNEGLAMHLRIVSIVFPYSGEIREQGKRVRGDMPPEIYCVARNLADGFIRSALDTVACLCREHGYRAIAGIGSPVYQLLSNGGSGRIYANWSERHVAFAAGMGTFSLHEALITEAGCNVRIGSVITDGPFEVTPRTGDEPYANCLHFAEGTCGECIDKCPAGAITRDGHDKHRCRLHLRRVREEMCARPLLSTLRVKHLRINNEDRTTFSVGCALCQFGVPCSDKNPVL